MRRPCCVRKSKLAAVVRLQGLSLSHFFVKLVDDFGYGTTGQADRLGLSRPDLRMLLDLAEHDPLGDRYMSRLQRPCEGHRHMAGSRSQ